MNKIAAGEIVERPASVVKELIENSIDAKATRIEIEIKNGGRQLIRVTDDGVGMEKEDAVLAIERHATSKITDPNDLFNLTSLGFRGEALPSVAAVSIFSLITKTGADDFGTQIEVKGGILKKVKETGAPNGTTVNVQDLFFNTPARFKYLKSIPAEAGYINEVVARLALGYPQISFRLLHHEYEMLFTAGNGSLEDTVATIFGKDVSRELIPINHAENGISIHGFLGKPTIARNNRKYEVFFINRRQIFSKTISIAVEKAFHTLLPIARYPFCVIFIEVDPDLVDVNVHPAKLEARFADETGIFKIIFHTVQDTLKNNSLLSQWIAPDDEPVKLQSVRHNEISPENLNSGYDNFRNTKAELSSVSEQAHFDYNFNLNPLPKNEKEVILNNFYIYPKVIMNTYIIIEDEKGLLFVDQHAAHERVLYEKFFSHAKEILESQALLIPETVTLNYAQYKAISERMSLFNELGFEVEAFGGQTLIIRGVPQVLLNLDYKRIIQDLIEDYLNFKTFKNPAEIKESFIITMACRAAIKAGDKLDLLEIQGLVNNLFKCENPYTCPHGRPSIFRLSSDELAKKFLRR